MVPHIAFCFLHNVNVAITYRFDAPFWHLFSLYSTRICV